jgi:tetratricopeptide (TPR) repeat protein
VEPNDWVAYCNRGECYGKKGEHAKAIADFTEAIRLDPKNADVYTKRGSCQVAKGEYGKAIADFTEAIRLDPKNADNYRGRGSCYAKKGHYAKAIADFIRRLTVAMKREADQAPFMLDVPRHGFRKSWNSRRKPRATLVATYISDRPAPVRSGLLPYQMVREVDK